LLLMCFLSISTTFLSLLLLCVRKFPMAHELHLE
jgi:hypothetical protein